MPDASKLDILSATSPPPNNSIPSPSPQTFRTVEIMYAHERENWGRGGLDLKNERVNLSKHTNTAMFATTNVCSVSENRALVATQHVVKKRRLTEMNCVV